MQKLSGLQTETVAMNDSRGQALLGLPIRTQPKVDLFDLRLRRMRLLNYQDRRGGGHRNVEMNRPQTAVEPERQNANQSKDTDKGSTSRARHGRRLPAVTLATISLRLWLLRSC